MSSSRNQNMGRKRRREICHGTDKPVSLAKKARFQLENEIKTAVNAEIVASDTPSESLCKDEQAKCYRSFFDENCEKLAQNLLGKRLVRVLSDGTKLSGHIVETEAYLGEIDKAAHSYQGKRTAKNEAMFMDPGTIYVYHIYGIYSCINISAHGKGAAVLLRAIDPTEGEDVMRKNRGTKRSDNGQGLKIKELCSGPSKLTSAFQIDKDRFNKADITTDPSIWIEDIGTELQPDDIVVCSRIGINYAEEWIKKPLRFYIKGNQSVSIKDKVAEAELNKN